MRNLILFFIRFNSFFLFLLLEALALIFLVQNEKQKEIFWHSANSFSGSVQEWRSNTISYMNLRSINKSMAEKIATYKALETQYQSKANNKLLPYVDSLAGEVYEYIPSKVINNSTNRNNNYLTLDVGNQNGVVRNTGVVSADGLVGIVLQTSRNYSAVMSMLHRDIRVSAEVKRNGYFGSLTWKNSNPRIMHLEAIPQHALIDKGDTIITSGYSSIFPPGHMIGVVDTSWVESGSNFHTVLVELSCDLGKLEYAYVVKHPLRTEKQQLEEEVGYE